MKKIVSITALCLLALSPLSQAAVTMPDIDQELLENGIVGSDYKYKDINAADKYFNKLTADFAKVLPMKRSPAIEAKSVTITPYFSEYVHRYTVDLPPASLSSLEHELTNPTMLKNLCRNVYNTKKFISANNHSIVFTYQKKDGHKLTDITMNNATCKA